MSAPESRTALEAAHLVKQYGSGDARILALDDVSLSCERGSFVAVMGPSGSGKSTLMHVLSGLDTADAGSVAIGGVSLSGLGDRELTELRRTGVGFIFQSFNLIPTLTAEQNIALPSLLAGRPADHAAIEPIARTLGLGERLNHRPAQLSGGQQQRVAIARALLNNPDVIFADEPTGNLDSRSGAEVLALLQRGSRARGQTIVMVTHDAVAAAHADRVLVMVDGRIVRDIPGGDATHIAQILGQLGA